MKCELCSCYTSHSCHSKKVHLIHLKEYNHLYTYKGKLKAHLLSVKEKAKDFVETQHHTTSPPQATHLGTLLKDE